MHLMACLMALPLSAVGATPIGACGSLPVCPTPTQCVLPELSTPRDSRDCSKTIDLIFTRLQMEDPVCLADRAANNAKLEGERSALQLEHRRCLAVQDSGRLRCDSSMNEWESCVARVLPQFPPKSPSDRRFLYQRCSQGGGKDEFTSDCCSHLYSTDRAALGVCQPRASAAKTCRDPSNGVEQYSRQIEYSRTSPYMGGGFDQGRWCAQVISDLRSQHPQAVLEIKSRSETSKSVCQPFNCPNYQYSCTVTAKLDPVFNEKPSPACK